MLETLGWAPVTWVGGEGAGHGRGWWGLLGGLAQAEGKQVCVTSAGVGVGSWLHCLSITPGSPSLPGSCLSGFRA